MLSHELWGTAFGGRKDIVGLKLHCNGREATIIAVAAAISADYTGAHVWLAQPE